MREPRERRSDVREEVILRHREVVDDVLARADMVSGVRVGKKVVPAVEG